MALESHKKVYSIFRSRPQAASPPPAAKQLSSPSSEPPTQPAADTAQDRVEPPQQAPTSSAEPAKAAKKLVRTVSASSRATTPTNSIILTDGDDSDGSRPISGSAIGKKGKRTVEQAGGKTKKAVVADSEEEKDDEEELVFVEASTSGKGPKKAVKRKNMDKSTQEVTTPKKKGRKKTVAGAKEPGGTIDLTLSPARPSGSGFAPLSETYKKERERRKAYEPVEAPWPTAEQHGNWIVRREGPTATQVWRESLPKRSKIVGKGKGRETDEDFLGACAANLDYPTLSYPVASTSTRTSTVRSARRPLTEVASLVPSFPSHPLLHRLAAPFQSSSPHPSTLRRPGDRDRPPDEQLWTIKYGPKKAEEVLGEVSGASAMHLKEWLEELKVQAEGVGGSPKKRRRPINRGVTKPKKKKKKRPLDDFLASSDDEEDDTGAAAASAYYDLDDYISSDEDAAPSSSHRTNSISVFPSLTNLLLLHGPHGSGKTSSVHAVAQELGYEVFEVYPGMGKRRAHDLERYVGDVGKNHIMRASPKKKGGTVDLYSLFAKHGKGDGKKEDKGKGKGKGKAHGDEDLALKDVAPTPAQSLILIDEVDVLYAKEDDFWQGVVALAKDSRRPIVMTCTDHSLIPFADLGLQEIILYSHLVPQKYLEFAAPSPSLAVPYLGLLALHEGHLIDSPTLSALYDASSSRPYPPYLAQSQPGDRPIPHPLSGAPLPSRDLRKAVMQLQFEGQRRGMRGEESGEGNEGMSRWCVDGVRVLKREEEEGEEPEQGSNGAQLRAGVSSMQSGEEQNELKRLETVVGATEVLSATDALVERRNRTKLEDDDSGRFSTPADAELTFPILEPIVEDDKRTMLLFIGAEPELASEMRRLAKALWKESLKFGEIEDEALEEKRSQFSFQLFQLTAAQGSDHSLIHPPWAPAFPHPVATTLYRPFLRHMTLCDDAWVAFAGDGEHDEREESAGRVGVTMGGGGGVSAKTRRSTRHKKEKVYRRKLPWQSQEEAEWLRGSGFPGMEEEDRVVVDENERGGQQRAVDGPGLSENR
ncbi:hypothetical protein JCM11641_007823 [Rhodosporidiobolus odoratus]